MKKRQISFFVFFMFVLTCGMAQAAPEKKCIMVYDDFHSFGRVKETNSER